MHVKIQKLFGTLTLRLTRSVITQILVRTYGFTQPHVLLAEFRSSIFEVRRTFPETMADVGLAVLVR